MPESQLLLIEEVAQICRTSPSTVRLWIRAGRLRSLRPGRRRLIAAADLERFLRSKPGDEKKRLTKRR